VEQGEGEPLVWVHGLLSSKEATLATLGQVRGHRIVTYDQRGHGESSLLRAPAEAGLALFADDLRKVLDGLDLEQVVLGGESMGAAVVLEFVVRHPERVRAIIADRPAIGPEGNTTYAWAEEACSLDGTGVDAWMMTAMEAMEPGARFAFSERYREHWLRHETRSIAVTFQALATWRCPPADALARLTQRAVVRSWRGDELHPWALAEWTASVIPQARLVQVDRSLHYDIARDSSSLAECVASLDETSREGGT
jgi:pimeloyl-ACP methyl ester carboxylesterase